MNCGDCSSAPIPSPPVRRALTVGTVHRLRNLLAKLPETERVRRSKRALPPNHRATLVPTRLCLCIYTASASATAAAHSATSTSRSTPGRPLPRSDAPPVGRSLSTLVPTEGAATALVLSPKRRRPNRGLRDTAMADNDHRAGANADCRSHEPAAPPRGPSRAPDAAASRANQPSRRASTRRPAWPLADIGSHANALGGKCLRQHEGRLAAARSNRPRIHHERDRRRRAPARAGDRPSRRAEEGGADVSQETSAVTGAGLDDGRRGGWRVGRMRSCVAHGRTSAGRVHRPRVGN